MFGFHPRNRVLSDFKMQAWMTLILAAGLMLGCGLTHSSTDADGGLEGWELADAIVARIQPPVFPDRDFVVTDYGAVGDGSVDCTRAFRMAIDACNSAGGGRVVVPAGKFLSGAIHLKSNVNLYIGQGAAILFSTDARNYLPPVFSRFEGTECINYSPLIYAYRQENIAVTGQGVLDGQADSEHWWPWKGDVRFGYQEGAPNQTLYSERLTSMAAYDVAPEKRLMGEGSQLRPSFIQPYLCKNVLIEGVTVRRSPMWMVHPVLCESVTLRGIKMESHGPNNDACVPESCRDVLIEDCTFETSDDCITLKSGRNQDGRRVNAPVENVVVRNCRMRNGYGAIVIGSEISGGAGNIFIEKCSALSANIDRFLRLKTNSVRGGTVENVYMRDIDVGTVGDAVVMLDLYYQEGDRGRFDPVVRNIHLTRIRSRGSEFALSARGYKRSPISGLYLDNCVFEEVTNGNVLENIEDLHASNVLINGKSFEPAAKIGEVEMFGEKETSDRAIMPMASLDCTFDEQGVADWDTTKGEWAAVDEDGNSVYAGLDEDENRAEQGEGSWQDYRVETRIKVTDFGDNGSALLCGRYQDGNNYYAASLKRRDEGVYVELCRKQGKKTQVLTRSPVQLALDAWHALSMEFKNDAIGVSFDGRPVIAMTDDAFTTGGVCLITIRSKARFDDVLVRMFEPEKTKPPAADAGEPVEAADAGNAEPLKFLKFDFERGKAEGWTPTTGGWSIVDRSGNKVYASSDLDENRSSAGEPFWTDYRIEAMVNVEKVDDNSRVLLCGRYRDGNNYYAASISHRNSGSLVEFIKKENKETFRLTSVPIPVGMGEWHRLGLELEGDAIRIDFDGRVLIEAIDDSFASGGIGLLTVRANALYDDVCVTPKAGGALDGSMRVQAGDVANLPPVMQTNFENDGAAGWRQTKGAWNIEEVDGNRSYRSIGIDENRSEAGESSWSDYRIEARVQLTDFGADGRVMLCGRYLDGNNYYAAALHKSEEGAAVQLLEKQNKQILAITRVPVKLEEGKWYSLGLEMMGNSLRVYFEGAPLIMVSDDSFNSGGVALITINTHGVFDDVVVTPVKPSSEISFVR
jgi:polygalacturonase